jgi:hypothetical protein
VQAHVKGCAMAQTKPPCRLRAGYHVKGGADTVLWRATLGHRRGAFAPAIFFAPGIFAHA